MNNISLSMTNIAGFSFNLVALLALDLTGYRSEDPMRTVTIILAHGVTHDFTGARADEAMDWYLEISGQRKVQPVRGIVRP